MQCAYVIPYRIGAALRPLKACKEFFTFLKGNERKWKEKGRKWKEKGRNWKRKGEQRKERDTEAPYRDCIRRSQSPQ